MRPKTVHTNSILSGLNVFSNFHSVSCYIELMWGYHPPGEVVGF